VAVGQEGKQQVIDDLFLADDGGGESAFEIAYLFVRAVMHSYAVGPADLDE
jgi:hypothetical protein